MRFHEENATECLKVDLCSRKVVPSLKGYFGCVIINVLYVLLLKSVTDTILGAKGACIETCTHTKMSTIATKKCVEAIQYRVAVLDYESDV